MKKPRKPKAKRARQQRGIDHAGPSAARRVLMPDGGGKRPASRRHIGKTAAVSIGWSDEREKLALLLLPFFIVAFALGFSHTLKQAPRLGDVAAVAPTGRAPAASAPARPADALARAPAIHLPPSAPAASPLAHVEDQLARTAMLQLPSRAPEIPMPPEVRLGMPAMSLSRHALHVPPPQIALTAPALRLPPSAPSVPATPVEPAPAALPALPQPPVALGLAAPEQRPRPDICEAPSDLGRHVYKVAAAHMGGTARSAEEFGTLVSAAAIEQTGGFVIYNDKYRRMSFPMGDVAPLFGVCTDVVIRAYRAAGVDLQQLVHQARVGSGDTSIAHRRTETLRRFFAKHGQSLQVSSFAEDYLPGDIVTYHRPQNRRSTNHIAIVTDRIAPSGRPMIVHNRGWGPQLEDALFVDRITGHYRFAPAGVPLALEGARPAGRRASKPLGQRPLVKASYGSGAAAPVGEARPLSH